MIYNHIVIGAGASGLMFGAISNSPTLILEKNSKPGNKLRVSGGGRCNLTNMQISAQDYTGLGQRALPSLYHKFNNQDMIDYLNSHGIDTKVEENGKVFLKSGSSQQLIDFLIDQNKGKIITDCEVTGVSREDEIFVIKTNKGKRKTHKLIVATGGRSYNNLGTSEIGYKIAKQLGMQVTSLARGLVSFTTKKDLEKLSGVSIKAKIKCYDGDKPILQRKGDVLFTHTGLSGPAIIDMSLFLNEYLIKKSKSTDKYISDNISLEVDINLDDMPKRVVKFFNLHPQNTTISFGLQNFRGWDQAMVTVGGVSFRQIKSNFESTEIPGLYFIGEVLDIAGKSGGYNLQFCWSSGYVAAQDING